MLDLMVDIETAGTTPDALILTIAAQQFDPLGKGYFGEDFYARVSIDSQPDRAVEDGTIEWWATQPPEVKDEAFAPEGRISLAEALEGLHKIAWHSNRVWMQGPSFDATILEHAYKIDGRLPPWEFWKLRDSRTLTSLAPSLRKPPVSHHALEDCRGQIALVQDTLAYLNIKALK